MKPRCILRGFGFAVALLIASPAIFPGRVAAVEADSLTRSVQSALHERGFYYGNVSGRPDPGTVEAVRRYQIREGLQVTGSPDQATLKALGISTQEDPAARGASAGAPLESDRELLRNEGLTKPVSGGGNRKETTVVRKPAPSPPRPKIVATPAPTPLPAKPKPQPTPALTQRPPALAPEPVVSGGEPSAKAAAFVRRYMLLGAGNNTDAELACFADPVVYFDSGRIKRAFIRRDIEAYHRRWPERHFEIEGDLVATRVSQDGVINVRFRLAYRLQSPKEHAEGRTENEMRLRPGGPEGFEIMSVRERKL